MSSAADLRKARVALHFRLLLLPPPDRGRRAGRPLAPGGGREPARQGLGGACDEADVVRLQPPVAVAVAGGRAAAGGAGGREVLVVERDGEAAGGVEGAVLGDDLQGSGLLEAA